MLYKIEKNCSCWRCQACLCQSKMCDFCRELLGPTTLNHGREECPLAAAAYCGKCVCYGHFENFCPAVARLAFHKAPLKPVQCDQHSPHEGNILVLPDREPVHRAYLSTHGEVIYGKPAKNKAVCERIAKELGYSSVKWVHGVIKKGKAKK